METSKHLAVRLTQKSREQFWNVYTDIDWPERLTPDLYCMSPELVSIYGTELWDELDEEQRIRLSLYELANFFSLTLQGERPLVAGLSDRLYSKRMSSEQTEYLHHFIDEENKHMIMFGLFLSRYVGKVYPDKKVRIDKRHANGEDELTFFCKVMVVEELGDYYNVKMMMDDRIQPIVRQLNEVHHRDESRHLGFGRRHLADLAQKWIPTWEADTRQRFAEWLAEYLRVSVWDFYNPTMYRDAGLAKPYEIRRMALEHPIAAEHRARVSKKLTGIFLRLGLLKEPPTV